MTNTMKTTCAECGWEGTLHEAGSHDCMTVGEPRSDIAALVTAYKERSAKHGVDVPGGRCIAEDHTGHGHNPEPWSRAEWEGDLP